MSKGSCQQLLKDIILRDKSKTAVSFYSLMTKVSLSYSDLLAEAALIQFNIKQAYNNTKPKILFVMDNNPSSVSLYLACIGLGAIVIPINPNTIEDEIDYIIKKHSPNLIIGNSGTELEERYGAIVLPLDKVLANTGSFDHHKIDSQHCDDAHLIVHTSGTTSQPKGVVLTFDQVVENARLIVSHTGLDNENQLTTLPMYHVHAIVFGIFSSLISNSHLIYTKNFNPVVWLKAMKAERIVWSSIVPSLLPSLSSMKLGPELSDHLKGLIVSSAPILEEHAVAFEHSTGVPVLQAWGQSEFTCWATCCRYGCEGGEYDGKLRSVGYALDNVKVTVRDDDGKLLEEGVSGDLYIDGPFKMLEYYEQDSSSTITQYGIKTGDVGYWKNIHHEAYFFISGRKKEIINRAGEKLSPVSIEEQIYKEYPDIFSNIAVIGFPHDVVGEEIGIVVKDSYFDSDDTRDQFIQYLSSMHESIRPRLVCRIGDEIEMTSTGKIKRSKLLPYFDDYSSFYERFSVVESNL